MGAARCKVPGSAEVLGCWEVLGGGKRVRFEVERARGGGAKCVGEGGDRPNGRA